VFVAGRSRAEHPFGVLAGGPASGLQRSRAPLKPSHDVTPCREPQPVEERAVGLRRVGGRRKLRNGTIVLGRPAPIEVEQRRVQGAQPPGDDPIGERRDRLDPRPMRPRLQDEHVRCAEGHGSPVRNRFHNDDTECQLSSERNAGLATSPCVLRIGLATAGVVPPALAVSATS